MAGAAERAERTPTAEPERAVPPVLAPAGGGTLASLTALQRSIGNAAMGRLARRLMRTQAMNAEADRELGPNSRPSGRRFWMAYDAIGYHRFAGEEARARVWAMVGGSLGQQFDGGNTCATRVSYAFNRCGWRIGPMATPAGQSLFKMKFFKNESSVTFKGKAGDDLWYLVGAPDLETYLKLRWGPPDAALKTNADAIAFEARLAPGELAIFTGAHHAGLIMGKDPDSPGAGYDDPYVKTDPDVVPVSAWKLSGSAGLPQLLVPAPAPAPAP
jgi:hypothetical protein